MTLLATVSLKVKYYLGQYLGPAIEIGPALTANILKMIGQVIHQSTYWSLTAQELNNEEYFWRDFDNNIGEDLGPKAKVKYFDDMNIEETPTLEMYDNDDGIEVTPDELTEDLEPTPDFSTDVYLNSPIVLPREENMDRGEVVSWKQDVYGKPIGRENVNPILDSRWYEVDFDNGDVTEITANIIVEQMYAQCGKKGNDMLLLNSFIDYRKSEWAMSLQYQQITVNGRSHRGRDTRN